MINLKSIPFAKYNGTGNDFILIDNRNHLLNGPKIAAFTRAACKNKTGVGADGVILLEKSSKADFKMRIINADGSEPAMCGNGARCAAHFANTINAAKKEMVFETKAGIINAQIKNNNIVLVKLTPPFGFKKSLKIKYKNKVLEMSFINTGVPHAVLFFKAIDKLDVFNMGRFIRSHKLFKAAGTNVNFVRIINKHTIQVRTYERGVEGETLACGTGSTASALVSSILKLTLPPVSAMTRGNELLKVYFNITNGNTVKDVFLEGKVTPVFSGVTEFDGKKLYVE